jgi:hypothetical protein
MYPTGLEGQQQSFLSPLVAAWESTLEARFDSSSVSCPRLTQYIIRLEDVLFADRAFRLNSPISLVLYENEGGWCCENIDFSSFTFGATAQEAVYSFCEDFAVLWDEIANAPNEDLAPDAQRLKVMLQSVVRAVEKEQ